MQETLAAITAHLEAATANLPEGGCSEALPSMNNLHSRCNDFIQKSDHALQSLMSIVKLFYGEKAGKGWFEGLQEMAIARYGEDDPFSQFLTEALPFLKFIRNSRNCVEHPKENHRIIVRDFSLTADLHLLPPTIEIVHPRTPEQALEVTQFMGQTIENVVTIFELMVVHICNKHVRPKGGFQVMVVAVPEAERRKGRPNFGYGLYDGERVIKFS